MARANKVTTAPYSDTQAIAAMKLLAPNLRRAFHDGKDKAAREAMMLGSTLAGVAFSNASVALVHGMSRPIGALYHVPHGLSNAMLLPAVTEYSIPAAIARYADCARAMGVALASDSDDQANDKQQGNACTPMALDQSNGKYDATNNTVNTKCW